MSKEKRKFRTIIKVLTPKFICGRVYFEKTEQFYRHK